MIEVQQLRVATGPTAIGPFDFKVTEGSYTAVMGRTGAGKTSILEALAGLRTVVSGRVLLGGEDVTGRKPATRGVGYVPQDLALFSTMTVRENLAFGPHVLGWPQQAIRSRVQELAAMLGITHLLERKPAGLSGGEAQRSALGRALAAAPRILLLDEPLSALDDETRQEMYVLLKSIRELTGVTTLHVTHNLAEAHTLADEVLLLEGNQIRPMSSASEA
jgi:ABC-type sugar transport system ATPase subunit